MTIDPGYWITTAPSGERVATKVDGTGVEIKDALVSKATDPQTRQVCKLDNIVKQEHRYIYF